MRGYTVIQGNMSGLGRFCVRSQRGAVRGLMWVCTSQSLSVLSLQEVVTFVRSNPPKKEFMISEKGVRLH